jgi:uncharacterized protein YbjT (DUF2867 family)
MSDRILVIGGTRGTGRLIAELLHRRGYGVQALARNPGGVSARLDPRIEVVVGDITRPETLPHAASGADHIIFTAGVRSGRLARERLVKATDYHGALNALTAAKNAGLRGRFMYMNSIGIDTPSWAASLLNFVKGNTLHWRRRVEEAIRASALDYTIIRAGFLLNARGGQRAVTVSQQALPLLWRYRIARADVAEAFVEAIAHPRASRATFEIAWGKGPRRDAWSTLYDRLKQDVA